MIKYKADVRQWRWVPEARIEKVEAERETESSVWIDGRRKVKTNVFWNSFKEAKLALTRRADYIVENKREALIEAENRLQKIKALNELE